MASSGVLYAASSVVGQRAEIATAISSTKIVETPNRAARLVLAAARAERTEVARMVIEEVASTHPTAVTAAVRSVLTVAPEAVQGVLEAVAAKGSKASYPSVLAIVAEMNPSFFSSFAKLSTTRTETSTSPTVPEMASPTGGQTVVLKDARQPLYNLAYIFSQSAASVQQNLPGDGTVTGGGGGGANGQPGAVLGNLGGGTIAGGLRIAASRSGRPIPIGIGSRRF
jgi:hypothetical protein